MGREREMGRPTRRSSTQCIMITVFWTTYVLSPLCPSPHHTTLNVNVNVNVNADATRRDVTPIGYVPVRQAGK
jgi:hypothetical protein